MIQLKFKKSFYGEYGHKTDRTKMNKDQLDIQKKDWMENYLVMENGLIEFTIPTTGKYQVIQQSRSANRHLPWDKSGGLPAMGVNITLLIDLKQVRNI